MGWKETRVQDERLELVEQFAAQERSRADICRGFGVSRAAPLLPLPRQRPLLAPVRAISYKSQPRKLLAVVCERVFRHPQRVYPGTDQPRKHLATLVESMLR